MRVNLGGNIMRKLCPLEEKILNSLEKLIKFLFKNNVGLINFISITYLLSIVYFHTRSYLLLSLPLFILINTFFYLWFNLWGKTLKEALISIWIIALSIFIYSVIFHETGYLYLIDKSLRDKSGSDNSGFIGPEKISPYYMLPLLEELFIKSKNDLLFKKEPYLIIKLSAVLLDDKVYSVRPVYTLFIKNIGGRTAEINNINWTIYSKVRQANITGPQNTRYPSLFAGQYLYYQYDPDPVAGYKDTVAITLNGKFKFYKDDSEGVETSEGPYGSISYDGTKENYYRFKLCEKTKNITHIK